MELVSLGLHNFRNFKDLKLTFAPGINLIIGKNKIGKTNIIEALFLLSTFRSFRKENHLIKLNEKESFLEVFLKFEKKESPLPLTLVLNKEGNGSTSPAPSKVEGLTTKQASFQRKKQSLIELIGVLKTVLFLPETLEMVLRGPEARRRTLNLTLGLTDKEHLKKLAFYERHRASRNRLLRKIREGEGNLEELGFWERGLAELGEEIQQKRIELLAFLNQRVSLFYQILSQSKEQLFLNYCQIFEKGELLKLLQARRKDEIRLGETLFGPHRESFEFELAGRPLRAIGSRGEIRSAALSFKRAETEWFLEKTGERPILLLDDVLAELDQERAENLLELIKGPQLILTATNAENIPENLWKKANKIYLKTVDS